MNRKTWSEKEINYLVENYGKMSATQIAEVLGRTPSSVKHKLNRINIRSPKEWSKEELQFLKDNYRTMTYNQMANVLGRTKAAVDLKVNRLGLVKSKYEYNHSFFKDITTEEQAYWCGFIMADGGVSEYENNSCELSIKLQAEDGIHLKKFNKALNGNIPVKYEERIYNLPNGVSYRGKVAIIRLYSEEIFHDIAKYGVVPNKSLVKKFPTNISKELISHFIRGYFDGNGTIVLSNKKYVRCSFCTGSYDFAKGLQKCLLSNNIYSGTIYESKVSHCFKVNISGMENVDNFLHFIYDNSSVYLDRKFNKKIQLYKTTNMEQRLLRQAEKSAHSSIESSEKENGEAEMLTRMEG